MHTIRASVKIILFGIFCCCILTGGAFAAIAPGDTPETQGIASTTSITCIGQVTENDQLAWRLSNEFLDTNLDLQLNIPGEPGFNPSLPIGSEILVPSHEPPLNSLGEIQMSNAYSETTVAVNGVTTYNKQMTIDTAGKDRDSENVNAEKSVQFISDSSISGSISSQETIMTDLVGVNVNILKSTLCPFAPDVPICWPPFCEIADAGSDLQMTSVSFTSQASSRTVAKGDNFQDTPVPSIADVPPDLHYTINVQGFGPGSPADGNVEALVRIHSIDGRSVPVGGASSELQYRDASVASGLIEGFQKSLDYESGIKR